MRTTIEQLKRQGWSIRQIARELGINRRTVAKYSRGISLPLTNSKCTIPPAGNLAGADSKCTTPSAEVPAGTQHTASQSSCVPFHRFIEKSLIEGLTAQRIYQDCGLNLVLVIVTTL